MSRKKKKHHSIRRPNVTADWVAQGVDIDDFRLIRDAFEDWVDSRGNTGLNEELFEEEYDLRSLRGIKLDNDELEHHISYREVTRDLAGIENPIMPSGETIREVVESILPYNKNDDEYDSIAYAFSRIASGSIDEDIHWGIRPAGLDRLSAAILTLHLVGIQSRSEPNWLYVLWKHKTDEMVAESLRQIIKLIVSSKKRGKLADEIQRTKSKISSISPIDPIMKKLDEWKQDIEEPEQRGSIQQEMQQEVGARTSAHADLGITTLRADGPPAFHFQSLLAKLRAEQNVLNDSRLRCVLAHLKNIDRPYRPTGPDIGRIMDVPKYTWSNAARVVRRVLVEEYIPSLHLMGLRYRCIISTQGRSDLESPGLVEKVRGIEPSVISKKSHAQPKRFSITLHLEPFQSGGPRIQQLRKGSMQIVANHETISFRLDAFDSSTGQWMDLWNREKTLKRTKLSLIWRARCAGKRIYLSQRQLDLIGILWATKCTMDARKWLIKTLQIPEDTFRRVLASTVREGLVSMRYLPALDLCGLNNEFIVGASNRNENTTKLEKWILDSFPYVRLLTSRKGGFVAQIRTPKTSENIIRSCIQNRIKQYQSIPPERYDGSVKVLQVIRRRNYFLTVLHRLREDKDWNDPWKSKL